MTTISNAVIFFDIGNTLAGVRISAAGDRIDELRVFPDAPLHLATPPPGEPPNLALYAIADTQTAAKLDDLGFWVDRLGAEDEPLDSDLYILRDDRQVASGFLVPLGNSFDVFRGPHAARRVITSTNEGLFVTIPAGRSVESYHLPADNAVNAQYVADIARAVAAAAWVTATR